MNKEPYKFLKNSINDFDHYITRALLRTVLQWKLILSCAVLGLILGAGFGVLYSDFGYDENSLSPYIKANIDSLYKLEQINQTQNAEDVASFIMTLDGSEPYQQASIEYVIRTDNQEDAEEAAALWDIRNSEDYLSTLQRITGYQGDVNSLQDVLDYSASVSTNNDNTAYADINYSIRYLTQEQEQQFEEYLASTLDTFAKTYGKEWDGFSMSKAGQTLLSMKTSDINQAQQDIRNDIALRLTEAQIGYTELITRLTEANVLKDDDQENYDLYWERLTNPDYKSGISIKELLEFMLIGGLIMGALAAGFIFLASVKLLDNDKLNEETIRELYGLQILAYAPKEVKAKSALDALWVSEQTSLKPAQKDYISYIITENMKDQNGTTVCMIHTDEEQAVEHLVSEIKEAGFDIVEGNILTERDTLAKAKEVGSVVLVASLEKTSYRTLEAQLHMLEDQKLHLMGVIVI